MPIVEDNALICFVQYVVYLGTFWEEEEEEEEEEINLRNFCPIDSFFLTIKYA